MKKIATVILLLVAVVGGAAFWLSANMDGLIKSAVESYGSSMIQAKVAVGAVKITPTDGKGMIADLVIGNPAGFKTPHALKASRIEIDPGSIAKDVVLIRHIAVVAPEVIYEKGEAMTNFDAIQKSIAAYLGPASGTKGGKKLIVEQLAIRNAKAEASAAFMNGKSVSVPLPDITLKNIGRAKGGVTAGELGEEVTAALKTRLTSAVSFDRLTKSAGDALGKAGSAIKGLFK